MASSSKNMRKAREIAARIWCDNDMKTYEMDATTCEMMAEIICAVMDEQDDGE